MFEIICIDTIKWQTFPKTVETWCAVQCVYAYEIWNAKNFYCLVLWLTAVWKVHCSTCVLHKLYSNCIYAAVALWFNCLVDRKILRKKSRWKKNCAGSITNMLFWTHYKIQRSAWCECDFFLCACSFADFSFILFFVIDCAQGSDSLVSFCFSFWWHLKRRMTNTHTPFNAHSKSHAIICLGSFLASFHTIYRVHSRKKCTYHPKYMVWNNFSPTC